MFWDLNLLCRWTYNQIFGNNNNRGNKRGRKIYLLWTNDCTAYDWTINENNDTVYPEKYAHGFVVLCFVVVMQSFIMNSHEVFIHIHQGCFAGTGAIVRLPQCQWSKPDGYGKIGQYITTTKHSKAKTVCIFLGIYCICPNPVLIKWICVCIRDPVPFMLTCFTVIGAWISIHTSWFYVIHATISE